MSLELKRNRANEILREIGITAITADNWDLCLVDTFLEYNDEKYDNSEGYLLYG